MEPTPQALRLADVLEIRGSSITIVHRKQEGTDNYGQPNYNETRYQTRAQVEENAHEDITQPGFIREGTLKMYVTPWTAITQDSLIEVNSVPYTVSCLIETQAYLFVEAELSV